MKRFYLFFYFLLCLLLCFAPARTQAQATFAPGFTDPNPGEDSLATLKRILAGQSTTGGAGGTATPTGTAGAPNPAVVTVQGVNNGTPQAITAAALPLPVGAAQDVTLTSGAQKTQVINSPPPPLATAENKSGPTITTTSGTVLAANAARKNASLKNEGTVQVALAFGGTATAAQGITLEPKQSYSIDTTNLYQGAVTAVVASGTSILSIHEGY